MVPGNNVIQVKKVTFCQQEVSRLTIHEMRIDNLNPDSILGEAIISLISPGTEIATYKSPRNEAMYPGYATIYRVLAVGNRVMNIKVGDNVLSMTPHQSHAIMKSKDVIIIPEDLPCEYAIFARLLNISMTALVTTHAKPAQTVIINGLGIIGNLGAQLFNSCGYQVICCEKDPHRINLLTGKGDYRFFNEVPSVENFHKVSEQEASLFLDNRCDELDLLKSCDLIRPGGEIVLTGVPWKRRNEVASFDLLTKIFHKYLVVRSGWEWELPMYSSGNDGRITFFENLRNGFYFIQKNKIKVSGLYESISPNVINDPYQTILTRRGKRLTYLIDWQK